MTDLQHKTNRHKKLLEGNERSYNELKQKLGPSFDMDTSDMRRELFFQYMVKWGIISEEQALDFEIAFHEKVESSLNKFWEQLREQEGPKLSVVRKPNKLLDQHGRPLGG